MLEMFSQLFAGQSLSFTLAALIPAAPPAFDTCSFINPNLFHIIHYIVIMGVQIKGKRRLRWEQNSA